MSDKDIFSRISTEQVLEIFRYHQSSSIKAEQAKLAGAATQLEQLATGKLSALIGPDEASLLRDAAKLVRALNIRVEHAKEIKRREEKRLEDARKRFDQQVDNAIKALVPYPPRAKDMESIVPLTELLFGLQRGVNMIDYLSEHVIVEDKVKDFERALRPDYSLSYYTGSVHSEITRGLKDYLSRLRPDDPRAKLQELLAVALEHRDVVRQAHSGLFKRIEQHLAIEQAGNVERLPVRRVKR